MRVNRIAAVLAACAFAPVVGAQAATFNVNTTTDNAVACTPNTGPCSLRGAVIASNNLAGADTINVPSGTYPFTIPQGSETHLAPDASKGDLDITDSVTITGAGADLTIVDAKQLDRVFNIQAGGNATIIGMTITGGLVKDGPGVTVATNHGGGGIQNRNGGKLLLQKVIITGNVSDANGATAQGMFGGDRKSVV